MKGILILAHGSREAQTLQTMEAVFDMVKKELPNLTVEHAYMEFCGQTLTKGLDLLTAQGIDDIVVVPYFLFSGIHIREDIPAQIHDYLAAHPAVTVTMGASLGADPRIAQVLCDRIREVL